jgi:drug/metabolite transporter (DMT)-like permease
MGNLTWTVLLLLIVMIWGWTFPMVKDAVTAYGVLSFLALRFVIGAAAISPLAARRITRRSLPIGGLLGIALAGGYLLQTFGLRYTTATNCGLITGLFAVFTLLANRLLFGVRTRPMSWATIGLSMLGLALLMAAGPSWPSIGDLLTLGGAACFGVQIALLDRFAKHHDATALALLQVSTAALIFLLAWPLTEPLQWPTANVWPALAITGILATAVGFYVMTGAQQHLPAVRAVLIISLEPVFAVFFGYLLAGDRLEPLQIAGAVLMIGAVMLAEVLSAR